MSFLNPSVLLVLTAVSIPVIIHLLNLKKIRKIEFSTLMFLKEIQKSKMRRIKLRQIVLLMLRIFAIVFLVLCFARPVYEGYAGNDNSSRSTVLIFLDDSFSMSARDDRGLYLSQAKEKVKKILESHKESDEIYLIPSSAITLNDRKILFDDFRELTDSLNNIKISYKPFSIDEALNLSDRLLGSSKNPGKEIFIISDFQRANLDPELRNGSKYANIAGSNVNTYLINVGERTVNDLSLDSFIVDSKILEKDKDIRVRIFLTNHSGYNVKNKTINLYIDNELKGEKIADVGSFEKKEIEFSFKAGHPGNVSGMLELVQSEFQDDEIIQDNRYFFNLHIPERFNIGLIDSNPADYRFIELAFRTASELLSDSAKNRTDLFNIRHLSSVDDRIFENEVVFISGKRAFSDQEAEMIKDYVSGGGGLFMFLGKNTDIENYNTTILNKLNAFRIERFNENAGANQNLKFDRIDFEHPVLSEVFANQSLNITSDKVNIESPKISAYFDLLPNESSRSIISMSNNKPFLIESKYSGGKIIVCALPATNDLSDLPLKSIFVPLVIRSVYYLGNSYKLQDKYEIGKQNLVSVIDLQNISDMVLPDKSKIEMNAGLAEVSGNILLIPYSSETSEVGNYTLEDSSGNKFSFALNNASSESNQEKIGSDGLKEYFEGNGFKNVKVVDADENITDSIERSRKGLGLWKYFLLGALMFIAAELLLSKKLES